MYPFGTTIVNYERPNRLTDKKDKEYHLKYGRYCLNGTNHPLYRQFIYDTIVYWNFYTGNQWYFQEDLTPFMMDESGALRNRIQVTKNFIGKYVDALVGSVIKMDYDVTARAISSSAAVRREDALQTMKFYTDMATQMPEMKQHIQSQMPIGDNQKETEQNFSNLWQDTYPMYINDLVTRISEKYNFEQKKVELAKHIIIAGIGVEKGYYQNGHQVWNTIDPLYFFFDRNAKRPDLKDAAYMGEFSFMNPTDIYEKCEDLSGTDRNYIETASARNWQQNVMMFTNMLGVDGRVPVYCVYWKDAEKQDYGYVLDKMNYPLFTQINRTDEQGTIVGYTDKDLIKAPPGEYGTTLLKGKKKTQIYVEILRYCEFIPAEMMGSPAQTGDSPYKDIVLDYGVVPYQDTYCLDPSSVEYPYKIYMPFYHEGYILSPIKNAISPQRYLNRLLSIAESQANNARGSGTIIEKEFVDPKEGEEGLLRSMNLSKPILLDTQGRGVNNAIGTYGTNVGQTAGWFEMAREMTAILQDVTGFNPGMSGSAAGGSIDLVGTRELQIQQGNLIQEPIYFSLSQLLLQCYQAMANQGKRIYADNPRALALITGDAGAQQLIITKDMAVEDFMIFLKRSINKQQQISEANQMLVQLSAPMYPDGTGLITPTVLSKYYGKLLLSDIGIAIRESENEKNQLAMMKAKQQAQQQPLMQEAAQQQLAMAEKDKQTLLEENQKDRDSEVTKKTIDVMGKVKAATIAAQHRQPAHV